MLHIPVHHLTARLWNPLGWCCSGCRSSGLAEVLSFPLLMPLVGFVLTSTVWQRDVARAHWVAHDPLMCHSVVPSFIYKAALLNIWWFWFVSLEFSWHNEPVDQQLLQILQSFLVGDAQCSPNSAPRLQQDVVVASSSLWAIPITHLGPLSGCLCSQCALHCQRALIDASDSCRVTFSVSGCWESKPSISPTLIQF